jgi:hydrocephalus-inducing protein
MKFQVPLGSKQPRPFKFIHYCQKPTQYQCRIEKLGAKQEEFDAKKKVENLTDFEVKPASLQQAACENYDGIEISVDIEFEPSTLAESRALLIISSPDAGEYQCMLYGKSTFPQPKGPYKIEQGKGRPIPFKNPFFKKVDFVVRIDNPAFSTAKNILPLDVRTPSF